MHSSDCRCDAAAGASFADVSRAHCRSFLLGPRIEAARACAHTPEERAQYEWNLRTQVCRQVFEPTDKLAVAAPTNRLAGSDSILPDPPQIGPAAVFIVCLPEQLTDSRSLGAAAGLHSCTAHAARRRCLLLAYQSASWLAMSY